MQEDRRSPSLSQYLKIEYLSYYRVQYDWGNLYFPLCEKYNVSYKGENLDVSLETIVLETVVPLRPELITIVTVFLWIKGYANF